MTCQKRNLDVKQGADFDEDFQIINNGVVENLTGCTIEGKARNGQKRADPVAFSFVFTINTSENRIYVNIPKATTTAITTLGERPTDKASTFYYDYELTRANGKTARIQQGMIFMDREITRP
jgi:hypothetical protein